MKRFLRALQYRLVLFVVGGTPGPEAEHREEENDSATRVRGQADFSGSVTNALRGIVLTALTERHFRIELFSAAAVIILAILLPISRQDWAILVLTVALVLGFEVKNTSAELSVDLQTREFSWYAKHAKDSASGAVLLVALGSVVVGILILGPPLLRAFY